MREIEDQRNRWKATDYEILTEQPAHIYPLGSRHLLLHDDFWLDKGPHLLTQVAALPIRDLAADDFDVIV